MPSDSQPPSDSALASVSGSVTVVEMSGNETDEQCKDIAWQMMCNAHPVEAHAYDPDRFWKYFHARAPHVSRDQMVAMLKECEESH